MLGGACAPPPYLTYMSPMWQADPLEPLPDGAAPVQLSVLQPWAYVQIACLGTINSTICAGVYCCMLIVCVDISSKALWVFWFVFFASKRLFYVIRYNSTYIRWEELIP